MVFMRVRQYDAEQVLAFLLEEGDVGHDQVDARQMIFAAEGDTEIDRHKTALLAVAEPVDRQVHADLADAAERCKGEFVGARHHGRPCESAGNTSPAVIASRCPSGKRSISRPV